MKIFFYIIRFIIFLFVIPLLFGCNPYEKSRTFSSAIQSDHVPDYLSDTCFLNYKEMFSIASVEKFYRNINYRTAWSSKMILTAEADSLINFLKKSKSYGFIPQQYHVEEINKILPILLSTWNDPVLMAQIDKILTDSYLTLGFHLKYGRLENSSFRRISPPQDPDSLLIQNLEYALDSKKIRASLEKLEPDHAQYHLLKKELQKRLHLPESRKERV